jgi:hypothetical protein
MLLLSTRLSVMVSRALALLEVVASLILLELKQPVVQAPTYVLVLSVVEPLL